MNKPAYGRQKDRGKKLSWIYRQKKRLKRQENANVAEASEIDNANENGQNSRIIVRNLPFKVTEKDVRKFYESFGEITEINLLKRPDGNLVGCGFIRFQRVEDASKAIFNTNKKELLGRTIYSDWAISKSKFCEKLDKGLTGNERTNSKSFRYFSLQDEQNGEHEEREQHDEHEERDNNETHEKGIAKEKDNLKRQKRRQFLKKIKQKKRARIVIRNLSFQVTEDSLKEYFSQYGELDEIKILTKPDGKPTGVAFLQFNIVQNAAKAIHYANMKPLLDRPMIVDWAIPKNKFSQNSADVKPEIERETVDENDITEMKIEDENDSDTEVDSNEVTIESIKTDNASDENDAEIKDETEDIDNDENSNNAQEDDDEDDNDDDDDDINITVNSPVKQEKDDDNRSDTKHPRRISNDVSEGKTIFLKNLPFSVNNDELKKYMEQFGPVFYALVCIDPLTEHSKGTAFVKFCHVEDAEKCLASEELRLRDQVIEAHRALHRNQVENQKSLKEQKSKDGRNLYLIKEGVVLAGSPAAEGVSVSDMEKRLKLEQWKSQMLRNLNMFVSRIRLVVHNLPLDLDDAKLRQLFKNHSGPKAVIREARVMRDLKNIDATGIGKSKEYGFVAFTTHEDALKALRNINNNPNIFSKHQRPIIGFSIENRILVNAKERRIQKSRDRNPLWSGKDNKSSKRKIEDAKSEKVPVKRLKVRKSNDSNENSYAGVIGKMGQDKLRSKQKLQSQAQLHMQTVKKQKKLSKTAKELKIVRKEKAKKKQENMPVKRKRKYDEDDANFNKLLNNYRNKLKGIDLKRSKWYESTDKS